MKLLFSCGPAILFALVAGSSLSNADISGFTSGSYQYNTADAGSPPTVGAGWIQLTGGANQRRGIFFKNKQNINQFQASFTYRAPHIEACAILQGLAFVIQNENTGASAIGGSSGGFFGPSGLGFSGLTKSVAVTLETDTGPGRTYTGVYSAGAFSGRAAEVSPVNAFSGHDLHVSIGYDGTLMNIVMTDSVTSQSFNRSFLVGSLSNVVGSDSAYIGFTASTGGGFSFGGADQILSDFSFSVPAPASSMLLAAGLIAGRRKRA